MERTELVGKGAVVDTEGLRSRYWGIKNWGIKDRPLVLQSTAVSRAFGQKSGDFVGAAADAEGADGSLLDFGFKEVKESIVLQVVGGGLVEEPEIDVISAQSGEAAVKGFFGFCGSECGVRVVPRSSVDRLCKMFLDSGQFFYDWTREVAAEREQ